ncbi:MAG: Gfo/Idh/MocA family oxidoreductase [Clostridia bacterium]|nr:Gfo/Idh/MocA family oxidoreductase [Clostridia bacterium]
MKNIRIGVFGAKRGYYYFDNLLANNAEIVAVCDKDNNSLERAKNRLANDVAIYSDFDSFIEHPMDAVLLANYFHEHSEYAIRCLEKNIHVLCECTSNSTMAEGVALVRAAKKSKAFYMLAENYPFMLFNQEMKRVYEGGTLGKVMFAEGEYNHPGDVYKNSGIYSLYDDLKHWRQYVPRTYYVTHSLAPIMYATGSLPVRVTAMPVYMPSPEDCTRASCVGDKAAIITCLNDDNSVFRVTGCSAFGAEENSYRICGTKGQIENVRGSDNMMVLNYNSWEIPEGMKKHNYYKTELVDKDAELIKKAGHGGGDFFVVRKFFEAIRTNTPPELDVYFATRLASVAIMAHRSLLEGGMPYDIPDFRNEEDCVKFENDNLSPFWYSDGTAPTLPCSSNPDYKPSQTQIDNFLRILEEERKNFNPKQ